MKFKLYNSLAREKQDFVPIEPGVIRMYVCGITVYDYCHLGHARMMVGFDVITRYLRALGWSITYVRNITDIDDKIIQRAQQVGETHDVLSRRFIDALHEDERTLNVLPQDVEPHATDYLAQMWQMIDELIELNYAYLTPSGDIYYRVNKFEGYGKLSGKILDELMAGARVEVENEKEDAKDFALWKAATEEEVGWESPWGRGRPGWHIECSAMARDTLGTTFDIHGGGPDLLFPHHENEIAQSESANQCEFARYWMHVGALRVDGEKMSKSLGNFFTIRDAIKKYHPEVVRYLLISSHYRSAINYSEQTLIDARGALERFYQTLRNFEKLEITSLEALPATVWKERFVEAMSDDFNTPQALSVLFELARSTNQALEEGDLGAAGELASVLKSLAAVVGLLQLEPADFLQFGGADALSNDEIEKAIDERLAAKKDRDFSRADEIREELLAQGIQLEDTRDGTIWRRV